MCILFITNNVFKASTKEVKIKMINILRKNNSHWNDERIIDVHNGFVNYGYTRVGSPFFTVNDPTWRCTFIHPLNKCLTRVTINLKKED